MRKISRGVLIAWVLVAVVILAGAALAATSANTQAASFGWFAYQPLAAEAMFPSNAVIVARTTIVGVGLVVVGFIVASFLVGWQFATARQRFFNPPTE